MYSENNNQKILKLINGLDSITYNHSIRVMSIATEIEEELHFSDHELSQAALLHDIGKLYVSTNILDKPDRLNSIEREIINLHPYIGYMILHSSGIEENICRIVLYHHGDHPSMLRDIDVCGSVDVMNKAHILRTIDVFEALTSNRPYHCGISSSEALDIINQDKSHHKDVIRYIGEVLSDGPNRKSAIYKGQFIKKANIFPCCYLHQEIAYEN